MLTQRKLQSESLYFKVDFMAHVLPDFSARILIGKRKVDLLAIQKTGEISCRAEVIEGIEFDDDIRQAAVLKKEYLHNFDRDLLVVAFHESPIVITYA